MLQSVLWLSAHVRAVCETSNGANQPVRIEKRRSRPWKRARRVPLYTRNLDNPSILSSQTTTRSHITHSDINAIIDYVIRTLAASQLTHIRHFTP